MRATWWNPECVAVGLEQAETDHSAYVLMAAYLSQYSASLQTEQLEFYPWQKKRIFPLASVQTSSEAHPVSHPMGTGVKNGRGVTLSTHPI
jgi:hypothetical protein